MKHALQYPKVAAAVAQLDTLLAARASLEAQRAALLDDDTRGGAPGLSAVEARLLHLDQAEPECRDAVELARQQARADALASRAADMRAIAQRFHRALVELAAACQAEDALRRELVDGHFGGSEPTVTATVPSTRQELLAMYGPNSAPQRLRSRSPRPTLNQANAEVIRRSALQMESVP